MLTSEIPYGGKGELKKVCQSATKYISEWNHEAIENFYKNAELKNISLIEKLSNGEPYEIIKRYKEKGCVGDDFLQNKITYYFATCFVIFHGSK